jgi:hypothetical protein
MLNANDHNIFDDAASDEYYAKMYSKVVKPHLIDKYLSCMPVEWELEPMFTQYCYDNYMHHDECVRNQLFDLLSRVIKLDFLRGENEYINIVHKPKKREKLWKVFLPATIFSKTFITRYDKYDGSVYHCMPPQEFTHKYYIWSWCNACNKYEYDVTAPKHIGLGDVDWQLEKLH